MKAGARLQLKLGQKLKLAPQLGQAIALLQLNRVELKPRSWGREKSMTRFAYSLLTAGLLAALGAAADDVSHLL